VNDLARRIDHTLLKAEATRPQIHRLVAEATEHEFAAVCIHGVYVRDVARMLHDTSIKTCAVVAFPLGAAAVTVKASEAKAAAADGAREIDFVPHLPYLLKQDVTSARAEMVEIVKAARSIDGSVVVKAILETSLLTQNASPAEAEARIATACDAARGSGCDFVKTSTGFHPSGGATVEAVTLLKKHCGHLRVKAAGGIRTRADAVRMIDAGADRLGCSASVAIVTERSTLQ